LREHKSCSRKGPWSPGELYDKSEWRNRGYLRRLFAKFISGELEHLLIGFLEEATRASGPAFVIVEVFP